MFDKIITFAKRGISWGRELATGNDGMGSASRVVALMVTTTVCGVLIAHVCMNHGLPDAQQLYGLAGLIGTGCGAFAVGKIIRPGPGGVPEVPPQGGN